MLAVYRLCINPNPIYSTGINFPKVSDTSNILLSSSERGRGDALLCSCECRRLMGQEFCNSWGHKHTGYILLSQSYLRHARLKDTYRFCICVISELVLPSLVF